MGKPDVQSFTLVDILPNPLPLVTAAVIFTDKRR